MKKKGELEFWYIISIYEDNLIILSYLKYFVDKEYKM